MVSVTSGLFWCHSMPSFSEGKKHLFLHLMIFLPNGKITWKWCSYRFCLLESHDLQVTPHSGVGP